jgi:hypothetical protein
MRHLRDKGKFHGRMLDFQGEVAGYGDVDMPEKKYVVQDVIV